VRGKLLLAALLVGTGGCNFWYNEVPSPDDLMHVVPWFDHMILSKAVHPYQRDDIPRNTPAGIVPVGGAEADWGTGDPLARPMPRYGFDAAVANTVVRPVDLAAVAPGRGQEQYQIYCAVCHGPAGEGAAAGTIVGMPALPLNSPRVAGLTDGFIYSYLRYGGPIMPQYGDKIIRIEDRWAVVDYVRSLGPGRLP
jgi:mono/diheme cytochrome c family protein